MATGQPSAVRTHTLARGFPLGDLRPEVYYRLHPIAATAGAGVLLAVLGLGVAVRKPVGPVALMGSSQLVVSAVAAYLFVPATAYFAAETRPYALWNALWLVALIGVAAQGGLSWKLVPLLVLLSLTATASIYQIAALGAATLIVDVMRRRAVMIGAIRTAKMLFPPMLVALYYAALSQRFDYGEAERYWSEFWRFWVGKELVPILGTAALLLALLVARHDGAATASLAGLLLYLAAPALNAVTLQRGFFFSSRQYIYFDLVYPVFLFTAAITLTQPWPRLRRRRLASRLVRAPAPASREAADGESVRASDAGDG